MRAKEYIRNHRQELRHADIICKLVQDLLPLRHSKEATDEYMNNHLFADTRYKQYLLQKELFDRGNALQLVEPRFDEIEGELSMDISSELREELFDVIHEDASFGYLFYILGTELNSRHNSDPIDCLPNDKRIRDNIVANRDDYPKDNLDGFINEDSNYQQYNTLLNGHFWDDHDAIYLAYFNRVYAIYDEIRMRKQSISDVRSYLRELDFDSDVMKYWVYAYIIRLIDEAGSEDSCLVRCKQELIRIIEPISQLVFNKKEIPAGESPVYLNTRKGMKIDMIRVLDVIYEMGCVTGKNGEPIAKKDYMIAMGKAVNLDLTNYDNDLSRSLSDGTRLDKHLRIFHEMTQKMTDIFNQH